MFKVGQRVKVISSAECLKDMGIAEKHIKHIAGKTGVIKQIKKLDNPDMYVYFVDFRYVILKPRPGCRRPYYVMLKEMIEPVEKQNEKNEPVNKSS